MYVFGLSAKVLHEMGSDPDDLFVLERVCHEDRHVDVGAPPSG